MSILIGADFVPTKSNYELFVKGDANSLMGVELVRKIAAADYRIFNLETPLVDSYTPIDKCGPNLSAPTSTIVLYKALNVNLLTLANNHIFDQGVIGLDNTCETLRKEGISYVGVGRNCFEAAKPFIFSVDGQTIGVYACVEHEFSIALENKPGANAYEPLDSFDAVSELSKRCEKVIVLYHGGKELYRYPSPMLQRVCRKFVEKGATLVICQHSHCVGCEEEFMNGRIVYGQGNFLFDMSNTESWRTSVLIEITGEWKIHYIPLVKVNNTVRMANGKESKRIIDEFSQRSKEIQQKGFVEDTFDEFAKAFLPNYFKSIGGFWRTILIRMSQLLKIRASIMKVIYRKEKILSIENCIEDEAHRELLLRGLKNVRK